ncbi:MAG: DM13 domain-containing protein [Roseibacillus sp.]
MKTKTIHTLALLFLSLFFGASAAFGQSGTWTKKENTINGTWTISDKGGKKQISLKGFKTATAPDLKIFLSPSSISAVTSKNATKGAVLVAKLKSSKGDQTYTLPAGIDLSKYKSVIIHCEKYSKLWGAGKL